MRKALITLAVLSALVAGWAHSAVSVIFRGDLESGQIRTPATSGTVDYFFHGASSLPDANDNCLAVGNNPGTGLSNRIVTNPVRDGQYANAQTLYWECDYRPLNGGTLQKPRNSLETNWYMSTIGQTYWYTFSFYLPTDWISDKSSRPINLFQMHKSGSRTAPSKLDVSEAAGTLTLAVADVDGNKSAVSQHTWTTTTGEWHTLLVQFKPCFSGTADCGKMNVYLSNNARRLAGTEKTAIFTDTGPNIEYAATTHKASPNVYKYNWHCVSTPASNDPVYTGTYSDARQDYDFCMQEPPPSGTDLWDAELGKALPITVYFDEILIATAADGDTIDDAIAAIAPTFSDDAPAEEAASIIRMNGNNPLDPNDYAYFTTNTTTNGSWGVYSVSLTDGINTEQADGWISNSTGGCFAVGDLTSLNGGGVTVNMLYDVPVSTSARTTGADSAITDWTKFNILDPVAIASPDACFSAPTGGATIENSTTSTGLANMPVADAVSASSGDLFTARFIVDGGSTETVRLRVEGGGGQVQVTGTLGSLPSTPQTATTGTGHVVREYVSRGISFVEIEFEANSTSTYQLKAGPNVATAGATIHLIQYDIWVNRTPSTMSWVTSLNKPDVTAPVLSDCTIVWSSETSQASVGCNSSEPVTLKSVVTYSDSAPSVAQVLAGNGADGNPAPWSGTVAITGTSGSTTTTPLDPYQAKYAWFAATDAASNDTATVTAADEFIAAETPVTKSIKWDSTNGRLRRAGTLYTGTADHLRVYDKNPLIDTTAVLLAHAENVSVSSGTLTIVESDLTSGSINALSAATDYWWFIFDVDKDPFAFGTIQITVE